MRLSDDQFFQIIKNTPLVSMDLVVKDKEGRILMGLRKNDPAKGMWFVPGARIRKGETLDKAFERITEDELGMTYQRDRAHLLGVFDAIYDTNYLGVEGVSTHYVVIAYEISPESLPMHLPDEQHGDYKWFSRTDFDEVKRNNLVHPYNYIYFENTPN